MSLALEESAALRAGQVSRDSRQEGNVPGVLLPIPLFHLSEEGRCQEADEEGLPNSGGS